MFHAKTFSRLRFLAVLVALFSAVSLASAQPHLAIVAEDSPSESAAEVLTAQFSKNGQVILLERDQIQKVYHEQALSVGNTDYMKLGQILGADGLLLLSVSQDGANQWLKTRLVAVKPGVVLAEVRSKWPINKLSDWAQGLDATIAPFLPKLSVLAKDAVPLSVVNLSSALRSTEAQELERQLTLLSIERLTREPRLFILERRRMELLAQEMEFRGLANSNFWNGSYLLDGTIDRDGYSPTTVTLHARLIPPKGGAPLSFEVSGSRTNLSEVVNALAKKITQSLNFNSAAAPWNSKDEAERYFQEATWAYNWDMFAETRGATEAAWALGKQTKDVAVLRLEAYSESLFPPDLQRRFPIKVSTPTPTELSLAIHVAELFCEGSRSLFTNDNAAAHDEEWYGLGVGTVLPAANMILCCYYDSPELRRGNEEQLARLRSSTRKLVAILGGVTSADYPPNYNSPGPPRFLRNGQVFSWKDCIETFSESCWLFGSLWFENVDDAGVMFRKNLEAGYHPARLPRFYDWSVENDRSSEDVLTLFLEEQNNVSRQVEPADYRSLDRFLEDARRATNPSVRLEGSYLTVLRDTLAGRNNSNTSKAGLLSEIWEQRQRILDTREVAYQTFYTNKTGISTNRHVDLVADSFSIIPRTEDIIGSASNGPRESFLQLKRLLLNEYLVTCTTWNSEMFRDLSANLPPLPPAEARQFDSTVKEARERVHADPAPGYFHPSYRTDSPTAGPQIFSDTDAPLVLSCVSWKSTGPSLYPDRESWREGAFLSGGKLWSLIHYPDPNVFMQESVSFAAIDLKSGMYDEIPVPPQFGKALRAFEVTQDSVLVAIDDHIHQYSLRDKTWETLPASIANITRVLLLNGNLYVGTAEGLFDVDPHSANLQVLVSARRQPAANDLDSIWNANPQIFLRDGKLTVFCDNNCFSFSPDTRSWAHVAPIPPVSGLTRALACDDATLFWMGTAPHIFASWNHATNVEFLLDRHLFQRYWDLHMKTIPPTRWQWPAKYPLEHSLITERDNAIWVLTPRTICARPSEVPEPVTFKDSRQATLFCFDRQLDHPLATPVRFEKVHKPVDPLESRMGGDGWGCSPIYRKDVFLLSAPSGIVLAVPRLNGHWLFPKSTLDSRLNTLRSFAKTYVSPGT